MSYYQVTYKKGDRVETFYVSGADKESALEQAKTDNADCNSDSLLSIKPYGGSDRYSTGRGIASFMAFLGWVGVILSIILLFPVFLGQDNQSFEYVVSWASFIAAYFAGSLFLVGTAVVMRAIFDIADNSFKEE
ncbi:hypothetical protein [Wenzhouxiangella sediminis]|nr:hypothetical protein [Wenzhouxiangella sediminis]